MYKIIFIFEKRSNTFIPPFSFISVAGSGIRDLGWVKTLWRIRDVYPESRILIFTHPGSQIPDPKAATKDRGKK
jgi:hypothetical protein